MTIRSEDDLSPDPDDNVFCACAEQGRASFIATLNKKHFPQKNLTAKVISPGDPIPTTRRGHLSGGPVTGRRVRFGRVRVVYECGFFWSNPAF